MCALEVTEEEDAEFGHDLIQRTGSRAAHDEHLTVSLSISQFFNLSMGRREKRTAVQLVQLVEPFRHLLCSPIEVHSISRTDLLYLRKICVGMGRQRYGKIKRGEILL